MQKQSTGEEQPRPLPSEFMRQRRPDEFPETLGPAPPALGKDFIDHVLATLTAHKRESDFENFCLGLCQREICPNLRPQTGPVGGGDSHADSETYPVAEDLALRAYWGTPKAAQPNVTWGFAFSAKKTWKPKARSDLRKLAKHPRNYEKLHFVTNQPARDKDRSALEAALRTELCREVYIYDSTWIVDRVMQGRHEALLIELLHLDVGARKPIIAPRDAAREQELMATLERLRNPVEFFISDYLLAEEYLHAARVARELHRPLEEVRGYVSRAAELARENRNIDQLLRAAYQDAWGSFWWYDDGSAILEFFKNYSKKLPRVKSAEQAERYFNLYLAMKTGVGVGLIPEASARLPTRQKQIRIALKRIAGQGDTSDALWAETLSHFLTLHSLTATPEDARSALHSLTTCLQRSAGKVYYPATSLVDMVTEGARHYAVAPEFEELVREAQKIAHERGGQVEEGRFLLRIGRQYLETGKWRKALSALGKARSLLAKEESIEDDILALLWCSLAYEKGELFWAARADAIHAVRLAVGRDLNSLGRQAVTASFHLQHLELLLGRVASALQWDRLTLGLLHGVGDKSLSRKYGKYRNLTFDAALGILLLREEPDKLKQLVQLPDQLDTMALYCSRWALLFALGEEEVLLAEEGFKDRMTREDAAQFFSRLLNQPAARDLPKTVEYGFGRTVELRSCILGAALHAECENVAACVLLAENILSALEAFLAAADVTRLFLPTRGIAFRFRSLALGSAPQALGVEGLGEIEIGVGPGFLAWITTPDGWKAFQQWLFQFLATFVAHRAVFRDDPEEAFRWLQEQAAFSRALDFSPLVPAVLNTIGQDGMRLDQWIPPSARSYSLSRSAAFTGERNGTSVENESRNLSDLTHRQVTSTDVIVPRLWDGAGWSGVIFGLDSSGTEVPMMGLLFTDPYRGRKIFEYWKEILETSGRLNDLRIAVITGGGGGKYAVTIGADVTEVINSGTVGRVAMMSRIQHITPKDGGAMLQAFLSEARRLGGYYLIPASAESQRRVVPNWEMRLRLEKIVVRDIGDIGANDLDAAAVLSPQDWSE